MELTRFPEFRDFLIRKRDLIRVFKGIGILNRELEGL